MTHAALEADLRRRFKVVATPVRVGNLEFDLVHPPSADELIDEEDFNRDERLPYWAEIWPSSRVLADRVARETAAGRSFLELGCGVGLPSFVAARLGFETVATDYYLEATEFVQLNAARNATPVRARLIDWRSLPDDLGKFDIVAASDVLYEKPYKDLVAQVITKTLKPGGLALVTDPSRSIAASFPETCQKHGLKMVEHTRQLPDDLGAAPVVVDLREFRFA